MTPGFGTNYQMPLVAAEIFGLFFVLYLVNFLSNSRRDRKAQPTSPVLTGLFGLS